MPIVGVMTARRIPIASRVGFGFIVLVVLATGCASRADDTGESEFDCPRGLTRPFSVETLLRVANDNGVSLKRDPSCGAIPDAVESASNIVIGDDVQDDDQVAAREGHVMCDIADLPFAEPPFRVMRTKWPDDQETHLDIANLSCTIYPSAEGQIARLDAAFRALAKAPVEQRSCTQARPRPVTLKRLIDTAKKSGLRLLLDARCIEPGVVAQASTIVPYDRSEKDDEVFLDQGDVTCLVRESALPGAEEIRTTNLSVGKRFDFLNVSCTALPALGEDEVRVGRVRATFEDLG